MFDIVMSNSIDPSHCQSRVRFLSRVLPVVRKRGLIFLRDLSIDRMNWRRSKSWSKLMPPIATNINASCFRDSLNAALTVDEVAPDRRTARLFTRHSADDQRPSIRTWSAWKVLVFKFALWSCIFMSTFQFNHPRRLPEERRRAILYTRIQNRKK